MSYIKNTYIPVSFRLLYFYEGLIIRRQMAFINLNSILGGACDAPN